MSRRPFGWGYCGRCGCRTAGPLSCLCKDATPAPRRAVAGRYDKFDPNTQHGPLWLSRLRLVVEREPELEPPAIAERFGLSEHQAVAVRWHVQRGDRRIL